MGSFFKAANSCGYWLTLAHHEYFEHELERLKSRDICERGGKEELPLPRCNAGEQEQIVEGALWSLWKELLDHCCQQGKLRLDPLRDVGLLSREGRRLDEKLLICTWRTVGESNAEKALSIVEKGEFNLTAASAGKQARSQ
jgi:hypothetical protein